MKHRKKIIILLLPGIGLVLGGWLWFQSGDGATANNQSPSRKKTIAVETTEVAKVTVRDLRLLTGTLHARSAFEVAPKISGRLKALLVGVGDIVRQGQIVARLDNEEQVQQVNQARAELGVSRAALVEARSLSEVQQSRFNREKKLFEKGIGSAADLESGKAEAGAQRARVELAKAQVVQRQAALRGAEVRLSYTVIRAEWNRGGNKRVVGERMANEGEMLAPNKSLLSVLDIDHLTAVVHASEKDYPLLRPGQPVTIMADAYPNRQFKGIISRVPPRFEQSSRMARIEVDVPNIGQELKPGMFIRVEIEAARFEQAQVVPAESVVSLDGRQGVFVVDVENSAARFIPVRTGLSQGERVQIVKPALTGRVIHLGQHLLRNGSSIRLVDGPRGKKKSSGTKAVEKKE